MERFDLRSSSNNRAVMPERPVVPRPAEPATDAPSRVERSGRKEPALKRKLPFIGVIIAAVLLLGAAFYFFKVSTGGMIDSGYQAVFLTNGQVYFGKLQIVNDSYMKISNVYYIQNGNSTAATQQDTTAAAGSTNIQLVPLTSAVHGPKDEMVIAKSQVIFFENLKDDGQAAKLIIGDKK